MGCSPGEWSIPLLPLAGSLAARPSTIHPLKHLYGAGGMRAISETFFLLYFQRFSSGCTSSPPERRSTSGAQRWNAFDGNHRRRGQGRSFVFFFIFFLVQLSRRAISLFAQQALRSVGGLSKSKVLNRHEIERMRSVKRQSRISVGRTAHEVTSFYFV